MERGESEEQTAIREIREETSISEVHLVPEFKKVTHWYYRWKGKNIYKEAIYFIAEVKSEKVKISFEHLEYVWADYDTAMETLTYDNTKGILKAAHKFLQQKDKGSIEKFLKDK